MPSMEAESWMMGSISGFIFMMIGLPAPSGKLDSSILRLSRISIMAESMSADWLNSRMTIP